MRDSVRQSARENLHPAAWERTATTGTGPQVRSGESATGFYLVPPGGSNLLFMLAERSRAGPGGAGRAKSQFPVRAAELHSGPTWWGDRQDQAGPVRDQVTADTNCLQSVENFQSESSTVAVKTVLCSPQ